MRWLKHGVAALWLAAVVVLAGCSAKEPWRQESYVFGTRIELLIYGEAIDQAGPAGAAVLREFDRLHHSYHAWQSSELTALNAAIAAGKPAEVSPELAALLGQAQALAAAGDYLFDPGIGQMIALWGFQSDEPKAELPRTAALDALLAQHPSIRDLTIKGLTVSSHNRALALDFGGFLKGVALDRAAAILRARGMHNALINVGGNILALGDKNGVPWRVGIQHPRPEKLGGVPLAALDLRDGEAIGTSGDYHRYFEVAGKRYFHLLDPRTGRPAFGTMAVTILVPPGPEAGARSDALSKPIFVAGKQWPEMAARLGLGAVMRVNGSGVVELSPAMKARATMEAPDVRLVVRDRDG